jgi:dTDP-4-amino-4,6-dideoxygalactose transaminase
VSRFEEEPTSARSTAEPPVVADPAVPFLDLTATTGAVREEIGRDIEQLLDTNAFVNGPQVGMFEAAFAAWCGVDECVGVASGLDALRLGLLGLDIGTGDEVVVPALTFIATLEAVSQAGAVPVVVDVSERDYTVDPDGLDHALSARTRALLPVHIYGQMADMRGLSELAERHGLDVVEDACQAHGAERDGIRPGHASALAGFSFYPSKNLGAFGDAGAVVTRDARLARRLRALREHGETTKYHSDWSGYTARLDTIQACVLLRKLPHLRAWNAERAAAAAHYSEALAGVGDLRLPPTATASQPVWHLYVVRTPHREGLTTFLRERGIGSGRHYPELPHRSAAFAHLGYAEGAFPIAEAIARDGLSLPLFPGITETQVETVCAAVAAYFAGGSKPH